MNVLVNTSSKHQHHFGFSLTVEEFYFLYLLNDHAHILPLLKNIFKKIIIVIYLSLTGISVLTPLSSLRGGQATGQKPTSHHLTRITFIMSSIKPQPAHQALPTNWASLADRLNPNRAAFDPIFKEKWKSMSKSERKKIIAQDKKDIATLKNRGSNKLPFCAEPDDHCETSPVAYMHIAPVLNFIAERIGKKPRDLQIYDPYYCAGAMVSHLNKLGFDNVYNKPEDFYQVIRSGNVPQHDVLVTNPPYSSDHFDKLLGFLHDNNKPALLLIPEHLPKKSSIYSEDDFCFLSPLERYHYWTPEGMRVDQEKKKKNQHMNLVLGRRNSPFVSYWFLSMEPMMTNDQFITCVHGGGVNLVEGCAVYRRQMDIKQTNFKGDEVKVVKANYSSMESNDDVPTKKRSKKRKLKQMNN